MGVLGVVSLLFLGAAYVSANDAENNFLNPTSLVNWTIGTTQTIKWFTNRTDYNVQFWQQSSGGGAATFITTPFQTSNGDGNGTHQFNWQVQIYQADLSQSNKFFFWLMDEPENFSISSSYFYVVQGNATAAAASTVTNAPPPEMTGPASSSSTASSVPASTTSSPSGTSSPASAQSPNTNNASEQSATSLKVGLGVGLGLGIPLILIVGILAGMYLVKQRKKPDTAPEGPAPPYSQPQSWQQGSWPTGYYGVKELGHHSPERREMSAGQFDRAEMTGQFDRAELRDGGAKTPSMDNLGRTWRSGPMVRVELES